MDRFTLDFVSILKKYTDYVIVSGYVSILFGRARVSEDIDIIVPQIEFPLFQSLYHDLIKNGFYCLNADDKQEVYSYIKNKTAIRFAKNNTVIPNMELKCAKNKIDDITLQKRISVVLNKERLFISQLELQIAFKEIVLKSPKDIEDAMHLRNVAKGHISESLIKDYTRMLDGI